VAHLTKADPRPNRSKKVLAHPLPESGVDFWRINKDAICKSSFVICKHQKKYKVWFFPALSLKFI